MTFTGPPGSFELCVICDWEDDDVQLRYPLSGGANEPLLICQREFLAGWKQDQALEAARMGYTRDSEWRPLNEHDVAAPGQGPQSGHESFHAMDGQPTNYYWRQPQSDRHE